MEEAEVLIGVFILVFPGKMCLRNPRPPRPRGKSGAVKT